VIYYGMSDRLPNLSYYDSTGQDYGFSKPYSDDRARLIDEEVSRIINEQYERAKEILRKYAEGHGDLAQILIDREVIFTEDVEKIFGKRQWTSRTDEILSHADVTDVTAIPVSTDEPQSDTEPSSPTTPPPLPEEVAAGKSDKNE
ncbi:MAG: cell division protein FtsH, partial [Paramuribaculum sp.]|nr:cell division protein FtsH [Paramuribaculum sp.]